MVRKELAKLAHGSLVNGGFTLSPDGNAPDVGYAVSIHPEAERILTDPSIEDIFRYIEDWADILYLDNRAHLGGWISDDGKLYLDISVVIADRAEALRLAARHRQLAVYDLARQQEIWVEEAA